MKEDKKNNCYLKWCFILSILAIIISIISCIVINFNIDSFNSYLSKGVIKDQVITANFETIKTRFSDLYIWFGFFITT